MVQIIEATALINAKAGDVSGFGAVAKNLMALSKTGQLVANSMGQSTSALGQKIADMRSQIQKIDNFRALHQGLTESRTRFNQAQADVTRFARAIEQAGQPTRELTRDYERAQRAVSAASRAFDEQRRAVSASRAELAQAGIPLRGLTEQQEALRRRFDRTTAAMKAQQMAAIHAQTRGHGAGFPIYPPAHGTSAAPGGGTAVVPLAGRVGGVLAAGYVAKRGHDAIIEQHHDFQQAYLTQQAILGLDKPGQQPLIDQAEKIGKDTKFTNADIVRAQTDIGGKLPKEMQKPAVIAAITENTKNYALAMKVSMEEGAEAIVGYMKSWGYDLSSPEAASASAKRASNMLVEFAKTTGAKHHDIVGSTKFGAAPSRVGGFSEETTKAIEAQLVRVGYEGAMAGNFSRAVATKLAVPSRQGAAAIAGAGIEFGDYRKPGKDASAAGLSEMLRQRFGRGLNPNQLKAMQAILEDPEVMADKGLYSEKTSELLNATFARKTKTGKVNAQDADRITKTTDQFYNVVSEGVDTPRLFMDLLRKGLTPALAKYLFGQEHGGRAIGLDPKAIERDEKAFRQMPDNRAVVVADKMQEGAQGEWNKLTGSVQTFAVALGEATDGARAWTYKGLGALFDYMTDAVKGKNVNPEVAKNMAITPQGAPYRLDTWSSDAAGIYERSRRVDADFRRDPEGARGRAMMRLSVEPGLDSVAASPERVVPMPGAGDPASGSIRMPTWAEREAEATRQTSIQRVQTWEDALPKAGGSGTIEAVVKPDQVTAKADVSVQGQAQVTVQIAPTGALAGLIQAAQASASAPLAGGSGPGSTGTSMPEAAAPTGGGASP